ncbi:GNAT family N-acetyltransferase [Streptomyces sp. NPDC001380]|uniref:GNAT family N-acetyltransferase n=1 Tax=Streptomyces sp. NPDC001380 TaxID=3364566 RepID=UPI0036893162
MELVHRVRREVFVVEQGIAEEDEWDDLDPFCLHLLATGPGGEPLGTGRVVHGAPAREQAGRDGAVLLGRLAVLPAARGTGLGAALVREVEQAARELGAREVELHAQVSAIGFYERLGYTARGPEYLDAGIPHRTMSRPLDGPGAA